MKFYILEERSKMYIDHYIGGGDSLLTANMDRDDVKVDLNPCHFFIKAVAGIKDNWQFITSPVLTRGFCIDNKYLYLKITIFLLVNTIKWTVNLENNLSIIGGFAFTLNLYNNS
jgi:hypothetical protein